jgi:hypothetical protein
LMSKVKEWCLKPTMVDMRQLVEWVGRSWTFWVTYRKGGER